VNISSGAQSNRIGTNADRVNDAAERNIISGNTLDGVAVSTTGTSLNVVAGNYIGLDLTGSLPLGNGGSGVALFTGGASNTIGGTSPGAGNFIAFNALSGVNVTDSATAANAILGNSVFLNAGPGIDLGGNGATANDLGDADAGPNNLQNFPDVSYITMSGGMLKVIYAVSSLAPNSVYPLRVEFFKADADGQEGQTFLGFDTFTASDFAAGTKTITIAATAPFAVGDKVVATATDSVSGVPANTSEFSPSHSAASPWQNPRNHLDVNDDTHVVAGDALAIINYINAFGSTPVPADALNTAPYLDTSGDDNISPIDALNIINYINTGLGGEGEAADPTAIDTVLQIPDGGALDLLLLSVAQSEQSRRR